MGVWIETSNEASSARFVNVTPYVGVWIETIVRAYYQYITLSHPTWVCGLKLFMTLSCMMKPPSHPTWVCGLKLMSYVMLWIMVVTPYVGVWIETMGLIVIVDSIKSHPTWVCGLKLLKKRRFCLMLSHTLRGCVD